MNMLINYLGHKQVVDDNDVYICPCCQKAYTNEGEGVLCAECAVDGEFVEGDD